MNLYLDDNSASGSLAAQMRKAGHVVVVPADVGTSGHADAQHLTHAATAATVSLTADHEDFLHLHLLIQATGGRHPGILAIRRDNDRSRDMKDRDVVRAIARLEAAHVPIENEFLVLNQWR